MAQRVHSPYNPMTSVRRDFNEQTVYPGGDGRLEFEPEMLRIFAFYREAVRPGTLLNLGAGPTHVHYMAALEDKLTSITALDLSELNVAALDEFLARVGGGRRRAVRVTDADVAMLRLTAQACRDAGFGRAAADERLVRVAEKSRGPDSSFDLVAGDMYRLDDTLAGRRFDNILLSFAMYVPKEETMVAGLTVLFSGIRRHLASEGRLIIGELVDFTDDDLQGDYDEDPVVKQQFSCGDWLDQEILRESFRAAGFTSSAIREESEAQPGAEFRYVFAYATK